MKNQMRVRGLEKWVQTTNFRRRTVHSVEEIENGENSKSVPIFPTQK
jgi:hypothetical protein